METVYGGVVIFSITCRFLNSKYTINISIGRNYRILHLRSKYPVLTFFIIVAPVTDENLVFLFVRQRIRFPLYVFYYVFFSLAGCPKRTATARR